VYFEAVDLADNPYFTRVTKTHVTVPKTVSFQFDGSEEYCTLN
jgi:hypothetical protein